jgi:hypothetical protein
MHRFPQQLLPLTVILVAVVAALLIARSVLLPDTFGRYGHYRASAVDEIRDQDIAYAGYQACLDCHDDIFELKSQAAHRNVACEACHGPAAGHVDDPTEVSPRIPSGRDYCPLCHGYNPSRPSGFPQILPILHNPGKPCMSCHDPHQPALPHAPEECSACHREIANKKAVSHHVTLPCKQCHIVPDGHLTSPRLNPAEKPSSKDVCAFCHAREASSPKTIPRIDIETHGERYVCWDCHYPHYPEAR